MAEELPARAGIAINIKMEPARAKARGPLGGILSGQKLIRAINGAVFGRECIKKPDSLAANRLLVNVCKRQGIFRLIIIIFIHYYLLAVNYPIKI